MNINIKATNITMTDAISDYTEKRLETVHNFFKNDSTAQCDIELAKTTSHHKNGDIFKAEIHIVAKDANHYASAEEIDLYQAIDVVRDEILRAVRSGKSRKISLIRRGGARIKEMIRGLRK